MKSKMLFVGAMTILAAVIAVQASAANPVPLINQPLLPDAIKPGSAGFTLTVNGTGFVSGAVVKWNGNVRTTTFISKSRLTASILSTDVAKASTASVTVVNPSPGGGSSNVVFFPIKAAGTWAAFRLASHFAAGAGPETLVTADFNRDHKLDLAVPNPNSNNVSILLGNGDGTFKPSVEYSVGQAPIVAAVGDFNRDGKLDLVVANNYSNNVSVLLGNGDGSFHAAVNYGGTPNAASLAIADFNGDGKLDLVVTNPPGSDVAVLLGNGDGTFQSAKTYSTGYEPSLAVGDLNGDGKLDLAIANIGADSVNTLLGDGHGGFQQTVGYTAPTNALSVALGDFNGDGKLDMAVPDGASAVSIFLQTQPSPGPNATLSSTSMIFECRPRFGCQCVTKGSLTLGNYGNQTLNISGITITGPFSEGNNCGTSLKPGRFCTISVTWLEQKGSGSGTLSIADNASGSPQTVSLHGEKFCTPLAMNNTTSHVACAMNSLSSH